MKLTLNASAAREIDAAIREIANGSDQKAIKRLCQIRGHLAVPDVRGKRRTELATLRAEIERLTRELARVQAAAVPAPTVHDDRPVRAVPKPHRRHVDKDRVAAFRALYTKCAVLGCDRLHLPADPHHLWPKGRGGPDDWANLLNVCPGAGGHHDEIEDIEAEAFAAKYASRLPPIALLKIKLALMMEAEAKLAEREAIDLDADLEEHSA